MLVYYMFRREGLSFFLFFFLYGWRWGELCWLRSLVEFNLQSKSEEIEPMLDAEWENILVLPATYKPPSVIWVSPFLFFSIASVSRWGSWWMPCCMILRQSGCFMVLLNLCHETIRAHAVCVLSYINMIMRCYLLHIDFS